MANITLNAFPDPDPDPDPDKRPKTPMTNLTTIVNVNHQPLVNKHKHTVSQPETLARLPRKSLSSIPAR